MYQLIIGIDISKKTLDWCVTQNKQVLAQYKEDNKPNVIARRLRGISKQFGVPASDILVCAEYTGKYIYPLTVACPEVGACLWLENAYYISCYYKRERGKNDSVDAHRIAIYAHKNQDDARPYNSTTENLQRLKALLSQRQDFLEEHVKYKAKITDAKGFMSEHLYADSSARWKELADMSASLGKSVEKEINNIIQTDPKLARQYELLTSIPGIGRVTAWLVISSTDGFTKFQTASEYCCYVGAAPFRYTSGSSVRSSTHVSNRANKELKRQIHMAALVATTICKSGHFHDYYLRKIAEGKNKMVVINAVRSKLITTMFAVVRDNVKFDVRLKYTKK